jgi:Mg2+/Co2+ transporter CorB
MKTRLDVHGIAEDVDFNTLLKNINEFSYSRFTIFKDYLDTVV